MHPLQDMIETAFENRNTLTPTSADSKTKQAVSEAIELLDKGELRVAEKIDGE